MKSKSAIIIGAGITGLTTAFYLKRAGWEVTILEKSNRKGGSIQTFQEKGFIYESGPNAGMVSNPEVVDLFDNLGSSFSYEPAKAMVKRRWVWKGGRWHYLPSSLKAGMTTPLFRWRDKFRLLFEPFRRKGKNPDETLDQLVKRRMGNSFLNYVVDPFIMGIYAGDPSKLVTRFAIPQLYDLEQKHGSFVGGILRSMRAPKSERDKKVTREVFSISGGIERLIDALVLEVGDENIRLNCDHVTVYPQDHLFSVTYECAQESVQLKSPYVISTVGAHKIQELLPFLNLKEKECFKTLAHARVVQVAVGFKKWRGIPINAFGGMIPHEEQKEILGVLFPSSFLVNRAPEDGALLSLFLGGVRNPKAMDYDDDTIRKIVLDELAKMFFIPRDVEPDVFKIFRHYEAIPQYGISTAKRLKVVDNIENQFPGIILAGNLRDGVGMSDRIKQGTKIAKLLSSI